MTEITHLTTISAYHKLTQLPPPEHPLISLVDYSKVCYPKEIYQQKLVQGYYVIGLKRNVPYKIFYGQQSYDFDGGLMTFVAPNQVLSMESNPNLSIENNQKPKGWLLLINPDFLWNTTLAQTIKNYEFFGYAINEALFLSEKEEGLVVNLLQTIAHEYQANIDQFSQKIIVSQIEVLLNYAERFYERQFITRQKSNHQTLAKLEQILNRYFEENIQLENGLPTVEYISTQLNLSANYLSSVLKSLSGMTTQQHIHNKLIEKAKQQLSTTQLSVSEIAYQLGFEHPSSFNKLFKRKTEMSPKEFRAGF